MRNQIILLLFTSLISLYSTSQTLIEIPTPDPFNGIENGYMGDPITFSGNFYGKFRSLDRTSLFKYDSSGLSEIIEPDGSNYLGSPIVFNGNLYLSYVTRNSNFSLFKYDGQNFSIIKSPEGYRLLYVVLPIIYKSELYLQYMNDSNWIDLFKLEGDSLKKVIVPPGKHYGSRTPFVYKNNLFLNCSSDSFSLVVKYDGTEFKEILSRSRGGFPFPWNFGYPAIVRDKVYMQNYGVDENIDLNEFDGDTLIEITSPIGFNAKGAGYTGKYLVHDTILYMQYKGNDGNFDLFKYDGKTLTQIASPTNFDGNTKGYQGEAVLLGKDLYLRYMPNQGWPASKLFKYDGTNLIEIPSPFPGYLYRDNLIVLDGSIYMRYSWGGLDKFDLMKFDGNVFTRIPTPANYYATTGGYYDKPFISGKDLFMRYKGTDGGGFDLFRLTYDPLVGLGEKNLGNLIMLYPNPTTENLTFQISDNSNEKLSYQLYDLQGKLLRNGQITAPQTNINMNGIPTATYLVYVVNQENKKVRSFKIIKK